LPAPIKGFEKQLARHARPVTLDQLRGHAGPPFSGDTTVAQTDANPLNQ
jgi:hypothetical protein